MGFGIWVGSRTMHTPSPLQSLKKGIYSSTTQPNWNGSRFSPGDLELGAKGILGNLLQFWGCAVRLGTCKEAGAAKWLGKRIQSREKGNGEGTQVEQRWVKKRFYIGLFSVSRCLQMLRRHCPYILESLLSLCILQLVTRMGKIKHT